MGNIVNEEGIMIRDGAAAISQIAEDIVMAPDIETHQVMEWLKRLVDENRQTSNDILKEMQHLRLDFTEHKGHVKERFADIESRLKFRHILIGFLGAAVPAAAVVLFQIFK